MLTVPNADKVIRERRESLKNEEELEKIIKKRRLDFLDILLYAKVNTVAIHLLLEFKLGWKMLSVFPGTVLFSCNL